MNCHDLCYFLLNMEMPSDTIIAKLEELKIAYRKLEHKPIYTVDAGLEIAEKLEVLPCKCLLLRTRKKEYCMVLLSGNKHLSSKELAVQIVCSHLSFASKEKLGELLHMKPGAISPPRIIVRYGQPDKAADRYRSRRIRIFRLPSQR